MSLNNTKKSDFTLKNNTIHRKFSVQVNEYTSETTIKVLIIIETKKTFGSGFFSFAEKI